MFCVLCGVWCVACSCGPEEKQLACDTHFNVKSSHISYQFGTLLLQDFRHCCHGMDVFEVFFLTFSQRKSAKVLSDKKLRALLVPLLVHFGPLLVLVPDRSTTNGTPP